MLIQTITDHFALWMLPFQNFHLLRCTYITSSCTVELFKQFYEPKCFPNLFSISTVGVGDGVGDGDMFEDDGVDGVKLIPDSDNSFDDDSLDEVSISKVSSISDVLWNDVSISDVSWNDGCLKDVSISDVFWNDGLSVSFSVDILEGKNGLRPRRRRICVALFTF